jgi:hypothetical protein
VTRLADVELGNAFRLPDSGGIGYRVVGTTPEGTVPIVKAVTYYFMLQEIQCVPIALIGNYDQMQAQKFLETLADENQVLLSAVTSGYVVQLEGLDNYTALVTGITDDNDNVLVVRIGFAKNEDEDLDVIDLGAADQYNNANDERPTAGDTMDLLTEHLGV